MYLAYALFCEGSSDYSYFEVLLPRVIESIVLKVGRFHVNMEDHPNPKACLDSALRAVRRTRRSRGDALLPAIAQRQSMDALGRSKSFREFEVSLRTALLDLGVLEMTGR